MSVCAETERQDKNIYLYIALDNDSVRYPGNKDRVQIFIFNKEEKFSEVNGIDCLQCVKIEVEF